MILMNFLTKKKSEIFFDTIIFGFSAKKYIFLWNFQILSKENIFSFEKFRFLKIFGSKISKSQKNIFSVFKMKIFVEKKISEKNLDH